MNANAAAVTLPYVARKQRDDLIGAYLQWKTREFLKGSDAKQAQLVTRSGLSKGTISNILNKAEGAGQATIRGYAKALGVSVPELYAQAEAWWKENSPRRPLRIVVEDEYPNRARAADFARTVSDEFDAKAIDHVCSLDFRPPPGSDSPVDHKTTEWLDMMRFWTEHLRRGGSL